MAIRLMTSRGRPVAAVALAGTSLVAAAALGSIFLNAVLDAWTAIDAAGPAGPADGILLMTGAGGTLLSLWLGLGMTLSALSALPGALGHTSRCLARRVAPAAVRRPSPSSWGPRSPPLSSLARPLPASATSCPHGRRWSPPPRKPGGPGAASRLPHQMLPSASSRMPHRALAPRTRIPTSTRRHLPRGCPNGRRLAHYPRPRPATSSSCAATPCGPSRPTISAPQPRRRTSTPSGAGGWPPTAT